ncbi:MAG: Crp/Fnr family transcriptional regulator [Candidatus Acidiferrales bacterium]
MALSAKLKISDEFEAEIFFSKLRGTKKKLVVPSNRLFYAQGDPATHVFWIRSGAVKLHVLSKQGKEAVVALLGPGDLFGEWSVSGRIRQLTNAVAVTDCVVMKANKNQILLAIHRDAAFANFVINYTLRRKRAAEENMVDLMFNSTEKRLARALLQLANFGKSGSPLVNIPKVNQDTLAGVIGSTRTQVNLLMNKFKKMGFIKYNGGMQIHNTLLRVVLED